MTNAFEASFDTSEIDKGLIAVAQKVKGAIPSVLIEWGGFILQKSGEQVPLAEGTLQNSGKVESPNLDDNSIRVGYHTPYAHRLHEHPEYHFNNGRKGKFLEDPIKENKTNALQVITNKLRKLTGIV